MRTVGLRAAIAAATLFLSCDAFALSFDERWKSLFSDSEVAGEAVAAKAEMTPQARAERTHRRASRHHARSYRTSSRRGERHREWYKGGKRWHYVYARKRRG